MGLEKIGMNWAQKTASWVKTAGKTSVWQTKPINSTQLQGLRFAPNLACDTVQLSNTSYLSESFVKSLTQIKGKDNLDTAIKIKDAILRRMGYKHPELLQVEKSSPLAQMNGLAAGWCNESGKMVLGSQVLNSPVGEELIPTLYHELDHMDKFIKLYKSTSEKKYYEIIAENIGGKQTPKINFDFFQRMSRDVDITDFDVCKYIKAAKKYEGAGFRLSEQHKYFNNPFEVSAYNLEAKIRNILGTSIRTPKDIFPKNYDSLVKALEKQGITDTLQQDEILFNLSEICKMKYIDKNLVTACSNVLKKSANTEEYESIRKVYMKIMGNYNEFVPIVQRAFLDTEAYINQGLLTIDDVVKHMAF